MTARKPTRLSAGEVADVARAQIALFRAQAAIWSRPSGGLIDVARDTPAPDLPGAEALAVRLGRAVHRAAAYGLFRPKCLARALALKTMLEERGVRGARLCVGVRPEGGRLLAHAWVEYGTVVLADRVAHVRGFRRLTELGVVGGSLGRWGR
ncbi:MAG: lasso peptide biosynthesis B2 protein [Gemmatimonadales bacterium]|nr:lasso peptide biosynthesis B2 protein [Gemmatimonadales bacterium]